MDAEQDVIVAIATGAGPAAVGVVRLSGPGAHALALRLCPGLDGPPPPRRLTLARVVDPRTGRTLDQALVAFFPEGASYSGEEAVELQGHGGARVLDGVLRACLDAGARPARPGEFTRRALAAGRLDLAQAEAIALLAEAATEGAVAVALDALSGRASREVAAWSERLADLLAEWEAGLDFAAEDGVVNDPEAVSRGLAEAAGVMAGWLDAARAARPALAGYRVALAGRPNAGKSSLCNALLGTARAIVHAEPGTTRDVVGEVLPLGGVPCALLDTAGIRTAPGEVEALGVERARQAAAEADCVVWVEEAPGGGPRPDLPIDLLVLSKADLCDGAVPVPAPGDLEAIVTSAVDGRGLEALRSALGRRAVEATARGRVAGCVVAGDRQVATAEAALHHVEAALRGIREGAPAEAVASALRAAVERLLEVTGRRVTEDILERVFRRFCVGK
jgi:tRNA modification GTPase